MSQYTGVTQRKAADGSDAPDTRAASLVGYKRVSVNDLVINIMLAWNGSMGVSRFDGIASPAYCVYRLNKGAQPWYFHQLFRLPLYKGRIKAVSTGVIESRLRLYSDDLGRIEAILPPPDEQATIVRFLDHANRKIDGFIRAKRKLIGLLNEQKQAIIRRAVTRGLHPDVPLKPSGIPWLGDIPKHWEVARIGQKSQVMRGRFSHRPRNAPQFYGGPYPFIQTGDMSAVDKFIVDHSQTLNERGLAISKMFKAGTLAMIITGAKTGHVAILNFDACFPDSAVGFSPDKSQVDNVFLYYVFIALKGELDRASITSTQENLNVQRIRCQVAAWPSLGEQKEIVNYLDIELDARNTAIARTEREIALMQEYRTRLTADLVTGKLDVREAAAKLPEVAAEPAAEERMEELLEEPEPEEAGE